MIGSKTADKVGVIIPSLLQLAKNFTDTHYYCAQETGDEIPGLENICLWWPSVLYYILHSVARLVTFALLFVHFPHFTFLMFVPQTLCNIIIERYICGQKALVNNIRDALAALVAPVCNLFGDSEARQFYRWNCISFALNLSITAITLNMLSGHGIIDIRKPFESGTEPIQEKIMGWGSVGIIVLTILLSALSGAFAYYSCSCVHELQEPLDQCGEAAIDWIKRRQRVGPKDYSVPDSAVSSVT